MIVQNAAIFIVFPLLGAAMILAFIGLFRGPSLADRLVAFDLLAVAAAGIILTSAIVSEQSVLLDVASVWAVVAFVSVLAFAHYLEYYRGGI